MTTKEKILDLLDGQLEEREQAKVIGEAWDNINPTRENIRAFWDAIPDSARGEIVAQFDEFAAAEDA